MLRKVLVANRGEIARRIARTLRRMDVAPVALYTQHDAQAAHVREATEAVPVSSYLALDEVVAAARKTGADGVHPGYGFLSENARLPSALADAGGIKFLGPPAAAISAMGDKIQSKLIAQRAGVTTIPGFAGVVDDEAHALSIARDIRYPVMVKASAGGGGKGMRIAYGDDELREAFRLCAAEAQSAFGDSRLLIEKYVERARHIEVQVLADQHGNVAYLPERECSVQRRNQKVLEESPSPLVDAAMREHLGREAVALARQVGYQSAGTVEFVVSGVDKQHYFLEMNTRLQVEHPVTEAVTGLDLVEEMVRVANGERLRVPDGECVQPRGWAMEARVYAEDPAAGYLPSTGRLRRYREPAASDTVRVDSGFEEGDEVSVYYDPMLSKVITYGADREQARLRMVRALDDYLVDGVTTNIALLRDICGSCEQYARGDLQTSMLREYTMRFGAAEAREAVLLSVAADPRAALSHLRPGVRAARVKGYGDVVLDESAAAEVVRAAAATVGADGGEGVRVHRLPPRRAPTLVYRGVPLRVQWLSAEEMHLSQYMLRDGFGGGRGGDDDEGDEDGGKALRAPMPGNVVSLLVREGDEVAAGQEIAVLEAMKMQNVLRAPAGGMRVKGVCAAVGDVVRKGDAVVEFA